MSAASGLFAGRFAIENIGWLVRLTDPQIAPDGKTIRFVSRANHEENRYVPELVLTDSPTRARVTRDRSGVKSARSCAPHIRLPNLKRQAGVLQHATDCGVGPRRQRPHAPAAPRTRPAS